jgi:hypothetical protein
MDCGTNAYGTTPQMIDNLFVHQMDPTAVIKPHGGMLFPQNEFFYASGLTFVNYPEGSGAMSSCQASGCTCGWVGGTPRQGDNQFRLGFTQRTERLRFFNSDRRIFWDRTDIMHDLDGTLTGARDQYLTAYQAFNMWPECTKSYTLGSAGLPGLYCKPNQAIRKVTMDKVNPDADRGTTMYVMGASVPGERVGQWDTNGHFVQYKPKNTSIVAVNLARDALEDSPVLVSGHYYSLSWNTQQDIESFRIRYSQPDYLNVEASAHDWVGLTFGWVQKRYSLQFNYPSGSGNQIVMPLVKRKTLPLSNAYFGTASYPYGTTGPGGNNTVTLMLTPNISSLSTEHNMKTAAGRGMGLPESKSNAYTLDMTYNNCPPLGCNYVPTGALGAPVMWSALFTNTITSGMDVTLDPTQWVVLDVSPPPLGTLTIQGRLQFNPDHPVARNLTLTAKNIVVWGSLYVGSQARPFQSHAYIVLTGNLIDPDVIVDNKLIVGHKAIVNMGNVTMIGQLPFKRTWIRLASTANALATTLTLSDTPGWSVGNRIVVSQTEYSSWNTSLTQVENNYITAVSADCKTLTLRSPLKYRHYAGPVTANAASPLASRHLAAAVGLLSRNIVVMGDTKLESSRPDFGGHIYTTKATTGAGLGLVNWQGKLTLSGVELRNMGKGGMVSYAINIELYSGALAGRAHSITNCSFVDGFNGGILSHGSVNTVIAGNVIYGTVYNGMFMDPKTIGARITNNLVVGNYLSPYLYIGGRELPANTLAYNQGGISITSTILTGTVLRDNYVSGAYDMGYQIPGMDCAAKGADVWMHNNEAAGTVVGFFIIGSLGKQCRWVDGVTSWKASHLGVFAADHTGNFSLSNALIADSHIGFNAFMGAAGTGTSIQYAEVFNSTIVGSSPASTCSASLTCRALGPVDKWGKNPCPSSWGVGYRHVGIQTPQFSNDRVGDTTIQTAMNMALQNAGWKGAAIPWDRSFGAAFGFFAQLRVNNVAFSGFTASDCGLKSSALGVSPLEGDITVPVLASRITWDSSVDAAAKFGMGSNIRPLYVDTDGTLLGGVKGSTLLSNAARVGVAEPVCVKSLSFDNGTVCPFTYRTATLLNIDTRNGGSPVETQPTGVENVQQATDVQRLTSPYGPAADRATPRASVVADIDHCSGGSLNDMGPDANHFHVLPGSLTLIHPRATEPVQSRIYYNSPDVADKVLLQYFITKPNSQSFFIDGLPVKTRNEKAAFAVRTPLYYYPTLSTQLYAVCHPI